MAFWVQTPRGFWGPWLTQEQAAQMAADEQAAYGDQGWRVVGEDAGGWPDPTRWLTVVASEQLEPSDLPAIESVAVGLAEARDQWRANALSGYPGSWRRRRRE